MSLSPLGRMAPCPSLVAGEGDNQDPLHARVSSLPEPQSPGVGLGDCSRKESVSVCVCVCVCLTLSGRKTDLCDTVCI